MKKNILFFLLYTIMCFTSYSQNKPVSYTHLDVYKRQHQERINTLLPSHSRLWTLLLPSAPITAPRHPKDVYKRQQLQPQVLFCKVHNPFH